MSDPMLAGRFRRLFATAIDALLVPALTLFLVMVTGTVEHAKDFSDNWWMLHILLLAILSYLLLNGYLLWRGGQTIGKYCLGIAIIPQGATDTSTSPALWKLICIRAWFFPLLFITPLFPFGLIPLLDQLLIFTSARRCLHDYASGTQVVRLPR